jgi:UDP-3-O-[3-hydroxymyristoyl] glucosamine N-acyltransferase
LLNFGKGAYLSNRATIGTNIRLVNGYIIVDGITVEEGGLVGHLSMLGPGVRIGKKAQIGVGCVVGLKTTIGDGAEVGPGTRLEHGITIGEGARVGPASLVGSGSSLTGQIKLPFGSRIPRKSVLTSQEDVNNYSTLESRS